MTNRIVYIHPGDTIELRVCDPKFEANAREWKAKFRPSHVIIRYDDGIEVFDTISNIVWSGTGVSKVQMLPAVDGRAQ